LFTGGIDFSADRRPLPASGVCQSVEKAGRLLAENNTLLLPGQLQ